MMRDLSASVFGTSSDEARLHWAGSAVTMHLDAITEADAGFEWLDCAICITQKYGFGHVTSREHV
jgi:hypothetical protein